MLAVVASVFPLAAVGWLVLLCYGLIYWGVQLVVFLLKLFGTIVHPDPKTIAFYPTIFVLATLGLSSVVLLLKGLRQTLYPETTDGRSAFYPLVAQGRIRVAIRVFAVLVPTIVVVALVAAHVNASWAYVLLQVILIYASGPTWMGAQQNREATKSPQIVEAVAKLFMAGDYYVTLAPTSRSTDDLGPLLSAIDLIAEGPHRAFAIQIAHDREGDSERVDITQASNLQTTAWSLYQYRERLGIRAETLGPALVFVGRAAGPHLRAFSARNKIPLIEINQEKLLQMQAGDPRTLRPIAAESLSSLLIEDEDSNRAEPVLPLRSRA